MKQLGEQMQPHLKNRDMTSHEHTHTLLLRSSYTTTACSCLFGDILGTVCLVYSLLCQSAGNVLTRTPWAAQMVCSHMASRQIVSYGPLLILDHVTRPRRYEIKIQKRFISAGRFNTSNTCKVVSLRRNKQSPILLRRCYEDTSEPHTHIHTYTRSRRAATQCDREESFLFLNETVKTVIIPMGTGGMQHTFPVFFLLDTDSKVTWYSYYCHTVCHIIHGR